jgi:hypothetical protein
LISRPWTALHVYDTFEKSTDTSFIQNKSLCLYGYLIFLFVGKGTLILTSAVNALMTFGGKKHKGSVGNRKKKEKRSKIMLIFLFI